MAAGMLSLNPNELREEAGVCNTAASNISDQIAALSQLVTLIQQGWEGAASEAYTNILSTSGKDSLVMMMNLATSMANELTAVANNIETIDTDMANAYVAE